MEGITILDGTGNSGDIYISGGMDILFMPGEKIRGVQFKSAIIAGLVR